EIYSRRAMGQPVTEGEKYLAKQTVKNVAGFAATYMASLALNQAILTLAGSDDKVNFTDPSKGDWLRHKVKGRSLELTGGLISTIDFLGKLGSVMYQPPRGETGYSAGAKATGQYLRGKLAPGAALPVELATRTDYSGRPLPFSSEGGTQF